MENKKKQFFNKAFAQGDYEFLLDWVTEDFQWIIIGKIEIKGKEQFAEALKEMKNYETSELEFIDVITHGKKGCINGNMKVKSPNGESLSFSFCDVYEFSSFKNPKILRMTSYVVDR